MRFIGLILALGAIGWVLYQASGGKDGDGAVPESYQQSMEKAEAVEQTMQDAAQQRLQDLDQRGQ
ncbi:MAG: hypothetical protein GWP63_17295 [Haliea sp.]|jgi:hypothetical protein|nr:hypothetical protein [Haliea sp.]